MQRKHNKQIVPLAKELRKEMTKEERRLWYDFLRNYSVRFSRQKVLGKYIVDFYSAEAKLVIELDGSARFYKIINISVKLYPVHPVANLNAAAAAIEQGDVKSAGKFLSMALHDSLAYKNCRGVDRKSTRLNSSHNA